MRELTPLPQVTVVDDNHNAVGASLHIDFDPVRLIDDCALDRGHAVLRSNARGSTMRCDLGPVGHVHFTHSYPTDDERANRGKPDYRD